MVVEAPGNCPACPVLNPALNLTQSQTCHAKRVSRIVKATSDKVVCFCLLVLYHIHSLHEDNVQIMHICA